MAIAYRNGSTAGNASGGNLTIDKPADTADGDILIAVCYNEISASAWTAPEGWAQYGTGQVNQDGDCWINIYWKRASSEGANYTFNISTTWRTISMGAFSGALASGDPIDGGPTGYNSADELLVAKSITTGTANTMCIALTGTMTGTGFSVGTSSYNHGAYLGGCEIWYLVQAGAGASGDKQFAGDGATGQWGSYHLGIKIAATAGTESPSASPSVSPSKSPSVSPSASISPSKSPSASPSVSPSLSPSVSPSKSPSESPSTSPSKSPSASISPSVSPSASPSLSPSASISPSVSPSISPSISPSASISPSISPSLSPSKSPSASISPSVSPSISPSLSPSSSISPSESPSESPSASPSVSPSLSPSASISPSVSPSVSPSLSPSASISPSESPSVSPSASISPSESPSASPSIGTLIEGSTTWGHITGVVERNIETFVDNWAGTGAITSSGDDEQICLDSGENMISQVVETGILTVELLQNYYDPTGDDAIMSYRHGASEIACLAAGWINYTAPFVSLGFVQVKLEAA